jgi:hypothetical protein
MPRGIRRSINRGTGGLGIELRKHHFGMPILWTEGEGQAERRAIASNVRIPRSRQTPGTPGNNMHENREISSVPVKRTAGRSVKANAEDRHER